MPRTIERIWAGRSAIAAVAVAIALIVGTSVLNGLREGRWSGRAEQDSQSLRDSIKNLPPFVGNWERDEDAAAPAAPGASVNWVYRRQRPEQIVTACLIWGDRRTMQSHGPIACFPQWSLRLTEKPEPIRVQADNLQAELLTAVFRRETSEEHHRLRAFWGCYADGCWAPNPSQPGRGPVARLYLFIEEPASQPADASPAMDFARSFLPPLAQLLAATGGSEECY